MRLYIGLIHYPVYNKNRQKIASAITTFDLHDLSRLARTYGVKRFFVINPLEDQQRLAERVLRHWAIGYGATYNRYRKEAIELIRVVPSLEDSVREIIEMEGETPLLIATDASRQTEGFLTYREAVNIINSKKGGLGYQVKINIFDYFLKKNVDQRFYSKGPSRHRSRARSIELLLCA